MVIYPFIYYLCEVKQYPPGATAQQVLRRPPNATVGNVMLPPPARAPPAPVTSSSSSISVPISTGSTVTAPIQLPQTQAPPADNNDSRNGSANIRPSELYIPVVDMSRPEVVRQLETIGVNLFIPISNLTAGTHQGSFFIPIMTADAVRRNQTTDQATSQLGFPHLSGVMNLGKPEGLFRTPSSSQPSDGSQQRAGPGK